MNGQRRVSLRVSVSGGRVCGAYGLVRGHVAAFFGGREGRFSMWVDWSELKLVTVVWCLRLGSRCGCVGLRCLSGGGKALDLHLFVFVARFGVAAISGIDPRIFAAVLRRSVFCGPRGSF